MSNQPSPQTPPPKGGAPLQPDTHPLPRATSQSEYRTEDLLLGRRAVLKDLQRVLTVPFDLLRKQIVQNDFLIAGRASVAQIRARLAKEGWIVSDSESGIHWKGFETSPASSKSESKTFVQLTPIINSIFCEQSDCVVDYVHNPSNTPLLSRNNTSRPDGYIRLLNSTVVDPTETGSPRHHWFDIAIPFEFNLHNRDVDTLDNDHKIIWSLHNIMREDPCRRFAYGITIEDKYMKLWLTNRACLVVTEPINFMEDIDDFIFLFSALGPATDVTLGWDPTIKRILGEDNKKPTQYQITVKETTYTTTYEIATFGAESMVGRGTRVYEAKDAQGNVVAIKDSWKDSDRLAEGDIIAEILKAIRDKFPTEADEATKYFVSVKDFGDVIVNDSADRTVAFTEDGALPEGCRWQPVELTAPSTRLHIPSAGNVPVVPILPPLFDGPIPQKVHHRTVFHDVGTALQDMLVLKDIIACILDTLKALYYMHRVGWVHRDYSVGNALQVVKDGQSIGKLCDFEYAKLIGSETSHDVRTGTINFMAWEVDQYSYQFLPRLRPPRGTIAAPPPRFRMNVLHDLESVFWAFSWALFYNANELHHPVNLKAQWTAYVNAFPGCLGQASRLDFLVNPTITLQYLKTLSPTFVELAIPLYGFSTHLVTAYEKAEESYPDIRISDVDLEDIHRKAIKHLEKALEYSGGIKLARLHTLYTQSLKRSISDVETSLIPQAPKKKR